MVHHWLRKTGWCNTSFSKHSNQIEVSQIQSKKTQGFCVTDFVTLSDERTSRSNCSPVNKIKEPCV